jgi:hypothetical protein
VVFGEPDRVVEPASGQPDRIRIRILDVIGRGYGDLYPSHADAHQSAVLEQLQPNGPASGIGELANWVWAKPMRRNAQSNT